MPALILGPVRFSSELKNGKFPSTSGIIGGLLHLKSDDPIQPMQQVRLTLETLQRCMLM